MEEGVFSENRAWGRCILREYGMGEGHGEGVFSENRIWGEVYSQRIGYGGKVRPKVRNRWVVASPATGGTLPQMLKVPYVHS